MCVCVLSFETLPILPPKYTDCSVLQCVVVCCSVLSCVAVCYTLRSETSVYCHSRPYPPYNTVETCSQYRPIVNRQLYTESLSVKGLLQICMGLSIDRRDSTPPTTLCRPLVNRDLSSIQTIYRVTTVSRTATPKRPVVNTDQYKNIYVFYSCQKKWSTGLCSVVRCIELVSPENQATNRHLSGEVGLCNFFFHYAQNY